MEFWHNSHRESFAPSSQHRTISLSLDAAHLADSTEPSSPTLEEQEVMAESSGDLAPSTGAASSSAPPSSLSASEKEVLQFLVSGGKKADARQCLKAGEIDRATVVSLYRRSLVRFEIPINPTDRIGVPPLSGFVMNRIGNDYMESILYQVFVSTDETMQGKQLAELLGQDWSLVQVSLSMACRLGFAKNMDAPSITSDAPHKSLSDKKESNAALRNDSNTSHEAPKGWHPSWITAASSKGPGEQTPGIDSHAANDKNSEPGIIENEDKLLIDFDSEENPKPENFTDEDDQFAAKRVGLLVDSKLAACLMMSNLAPELKQHAVTLYEVGKIPHEGLDDFLRVAAAVERPEMQELEVLEYFDHAIALRHTVLFLRRICGHRVDIVRTEPLNALSKTPRLRVLHRSYAYLISMAPLISPSETVFTDGSDLPHFGPLAPPIVSPWARLFIFSKIGIGPPALVLRRGTRLCFVPNMFQRSSHLLLVPWKGDPVTVKTMSALSVLSDMLQNTAVLIHAFDPNTGRTLNIPFPHADKSVLIKSASKQDDSNLLMFQDDSTNTHQSSSVDDLIQLTDSIHVNTEQKENTATISCDDSKTVADNQMPEEATKLVSSIISELQLEASFGFTQLMWLPYDNSHPCEMKREKCDSDSVVTENGHWVPLCIHFGLPLFDVCLCESVCQTIEKLKLLSSDAPSQHIKNALTFLESLTSFIHNYAPQVQSQWPKEIDPSSAENGDYSEQMLPTQDLVFDGKTLFSIDDVNDIDNSRQDDEIWVSAFKRGN